MIKRFLKNTDGNFAIAFSVSLLVIMSSIGAAVDLAGISKMRSKYQSMADSGLLAAASSGERDVDTLLEIATEIVTINDINGLVTSTNLELDDDNLVQFSVSGAYNTAFMGMIGYPTVSVAGLAEGPLVGSEMLHITLVLDVTKSMDVNNKIQSLRLAANDLVDRLIDANNDNIKVSVIPFAQYVNVGRSRINEPWMTGTDDRVYPQPEKCRMTFTGNILPAGSCRIIHYGALPPRAAIPAQYCDNDGVPYICIPARPAYAGRAAGTWTDCREQEEVCVTPPPNVYSWKGCVGSRDENRHYNQTPEWVIPWITWRGSERWTKISGLIWDHQCPTNEIMPLTNDLAAVKAKITSLTSDLESDGQTWRYETGTYIPAGIMWGWRALDPNMPLTEAARDDDDDDDAAIKNIMILMTDGANTRGQRWQTHRYKAGPGSNGGAAGAAAVERTNTLTATLCEKVKTAGIQIHTIAYEINDADTRNMIQTCASEDTNFYTASDSAALNSAFRNIAATLIGQLRLTH